MPNDKGKRLVYISSELLKKVMIVSKGQGESIGKFVEDALTQVLKVHDLGYDPKNLAGFFEVMYIHKILGGTFVPLDVFSFLNELSCKDESEKLKEKWYQSGRWNGKYISEKFGKPIRIFKNFLEFSRWDLNEVEVKEDDGILKVRCVSTILSQKETELLSKFIEGFTHGMGYITLKNELLKGMIVMEFKK